MYNYDYIIADFTYGCYVDLLLNPYAVLTNLFAILLCSHFLKGGLKLPNKIVLSI